MTTNFPRIETLKEEMKIARKNWATQVGWSYERIIEWNGNVIINQ